MSAWLLPLKQEISWENWEADDNKVKLFFQGIKACPCRSNTLSFINWRREKTVKHFIRPTAFSLKNKKRWRIKWPGSVQQFFILYIIGASHPFNYKDLLQGAFVCLLKFWIFLLNITVALRTMYSWPWTTWVLTTWIYLRANFFPH